MVSCVFGGIDHSIFSQEKMGFPFFLMFSRFVGVFCVSSVFVFFLCFVGFRVSAV